MQQRFELRGHHQVHEEHRKAEGEHQRLHRTIEFLALPADVHAHVRAERRVVHHLLHFLHGRAQVDVAQVRRDDRHAHLVGAVDFARARARDDVGHRRQAHRRAAVRIDDQIADVVDRRTIRRLRTHQHVDLAIAEASNAWRLHRAPSSPRRRRSGASSGRAKRRDPGRSGSGFPGSPAPPSTSRRRSAGCRAASSRACGRRLRSAAGPDRCSSISSGVDRLKSSGRLKSSCVPLRPAMLSRSFSVSSASIFSLPPFFITTVSLAMFSPLSVGLASRRVPRAAHAVQRGEVLVLAVLALQRLHDLRRYRAAACRAAASPSSRSDPARAAGSGRRRAAAPPRASRRTRARRCATTLRGCSSAFGQRAQVQRFERVRRCSSHTSAEALRITGPMTAASPRHRRTKSQTNANAAVADRPADATTGGGDGLLQLRRSVPSADAAASSGNASGARPRIEESIGISVIDTTSEIAIASATVSAWSRNNWPAMPSTNTSGRNTAIVVSVDATTAMLTSRVPTIAACDDAQAAFARLGDGFEHHDRVVDHQARRQCEAAERHHVEAQVELVHEEERGDDRHRQRQADDERAPAIAQEQEDDQDREHAADAWRPSSRRRSRGG